jgi:hypothetical protein
MSVASVNAATYAIANASGGATTQSIVNASGAFFTGSVAIGYYSVADLSYLTSATTTAGRLQNFVSLGTSTVGPNATALPNTIQGVFSVTATYTASATTGGKTPFLLFGNAADFATSTQVAVIGFSALTTGNFVASDPSALSGNIRNASATFTLGTIYKGGWNNFSGDPTPGSAAPAVPAPFYNLQTLAAIPETSTTLLGALGALALLRRRRN